MTPSPPTPPPPQIDPPRTGVTALDYLSYFHYGGLCLVGVRDYAAALDFFTQVRPYLALSSPLCPYLALYIHSSPLCHPIYPSLSSPPSSPPYLALHSAIRI